MAMALTTLALALAGVGTGVSATGQVLSGRAAKGIGDLNAQIAETQAEDALSRGRDDEQRFRQGVKSLIGSQRAGFAASNVDVGFGSAVDVQADAAFLGELDALMIRENAAREASGHRQQAEVDRKGGRAAATAGYFGAAGTVLGGTSSILAAKYGWGRP